MKLSLRTFVILAMALLFVSAPSEASAQKRSSRAARNAAAAKANLKNLAAADTAFMNYDFEAARDFLDTYVEKRTKEDAARDMNFTYSPTTDTIDYTEYLGAKIDMGRSMLDRVEEIEIIDSINVPQSEFFNFIKISPTAGRLIDEDIARRVVTQSQMKELGISYVASPAYVTESGEDILWVGVDDEGNSSMFESITLADGSWDKPVKLFDFPSIFGNDNGTAVSSPFLMPDGVTLYFAADGQESLGGLDIFISRRDDRGFLQPSNIGMPYNSPYNDYLYAVDETTGAGWWATDRNQLEDSVTIYTFIPKELRINYPADTPGLTDFAKVTSIAATQQPDKDYARTLRRIANAQELRAGRQEDAFDFAMPDGRVLHRLSDFRSSLARNAMQEYLKEKAALEKMAADLAKMRHDYATGNTSVGPNIIAFEDDYATRSAELINLSNQVVTLEQ